MPDCAFAALGDPSLVGDETGLRSNWSGLQVRKGGLGMLHGQAECDGLPVELGRVSGEIVAARLEFTNDVAKVERKGAGRWRAVGRLRIGRNGGVALDRKRPTDAGWFHPLPLPTGWYQAERFETKDDCIGIRLVAERLLKASDR